jgi:catechol 2,3-dioxygenase-like lactoylglutathione lyase family enzyme
MTLQHVSLETRPADADAEVAWWAKLGFDEVEPPGSLGRRARWVQRGRTQIHLLLTDDPVVMPQGHAAVVCEDAERVVPALGDVEERQAHWGARRWYARTPAGHLVEVMAAPPPMT